jgi:hypothetical protein
MLQESIPIAETQPPTAPLPPPEPVGFRCPFCKTNRRPIIREQISLAGWIVFAVLLLSGCGAIVCWIGLLMKEDVHHCADCGMKLGGGTI